MMQRQRKKERNSRMLYNLRLGLPSSADMKQCVGFSCVQLSMPSNFYAQTSYLLLNFILCMVYNPDVQRKAQKELDEKVGRDTLPDFGDRDRLPYIDALINELPRWFPVVPLGVPHLSRIEDEYRNMKIPKESVVFANVW